MQLPWWMGFSDLHVNFGFTILFLIVWSVAWTGMSLWHSAQKGHSGWFIFFLFVHTAGIVEFLYLYFVARVFDASATRSTKKRMR